MTAPTCTTAGYTTHTCSVCGHSSVSDVVEALGHDFEDVVTAPTHDKMGYTTHTCKSCGISYVDGYTDALGHSYTRSVTQEPTCTEEGVMTFTCDCGAGYTEPIPVTEHAWQAAVTEPTCEDMGYTTYTCAHCGCSYISDLQNSLGHSYVLQNVKEATCTEAGYTGDLICTVCGDVKSRGEAVAALGHHYGPWTVTQEADCFTDGSREHTCSVCGFVEQEGIAANSDNCPSGEYTDLRTGAWYHEAVDFVLASGYMTGVGGGRFAPDQSLTRGQLITILYRMAGAPAVSGRMPFADVSEERFYYDAILWAAQNGVANGVGEGRFAPNAKLTREQMVTFLARYAETQGVDVTASGNLADFSDASRVSDFAVDAMAWAVEQGVITGVGDRTLAPLGGATRAQAAQVVQRLAALLG